MNIIKEQPAANPSSPSIQLIQLITPTIQVEVKKILNKFGIYIEFNDDFKKDKSRTSILNPLIQIKAPKIYCKNNLQIGDKENISSANPIPKKKAEITMIKDKKFLSSTKLLLKCVDINNKNMLVK